MDNQRRASFIRIDGSGIDAGDKLLWSNGSERGFRYMEAVVLAATTPLQ